MATSSSTTKPAIIIVHGAWSLPSPSYEPLKQQLEGLGYECYLPHLRTSGAGDDVRGQTWEADVKVILDTAQPLFDRGREVVIVAHSYGGIPGGAATAGNGVAERAAQGKPGGFKQIIYVAAFAIPAAGMDLLATFGGQWPPWADFAPAYSKNHAIKLKEEAKQVLFSDVQASPEAQAKYWDGVVTHSQDAFEKPVTFSAADITIPKSYLVCTQDQCVPGPLQEQLAESLGFKAERIDAGHFPFLSQPDKCLEILKTMIL
ncbi:hypothetical protein J7T55_009903 [Diaporthe amygdali]|uniref:uncharacterized protein n=1 Tax=Phomopsis amygdali TaxID=1214568 RepID=UPI0022FE314D|nr:uncharacterized protein J7T55_009903 [Diaporthe amygdali]KAJ0116753.1 hypothetical protein J7T55_009903 [Diaporthe amygdali]